MLEKAQPRPDLVNKEEPVYCASTGKLLFTIVEEKSIIKHESCGRCFDCDYFFHIDALHTRAEMKPSSWPIHYTGYHCEECWNS